MFFKIEIAEKDYFLNRKSYFVQTVRKTNHCSTPDLTLVPTTKNCSAHDIHKSEVKMFRSRDSIVNYL
jgi:hypothetical protein